MHVGDGREDASPPPQPLPPWHTYSQQLHHFSKCIHFNPTGEENGLHDDNGSRGGSKMILLQSDKVHIGGVRPGWMDASTNIRNYIYIYINVKKKKKKKKKAKSEYYHIVKHQW